MVYNERRELIRERVTNIVGAETKYAVNKYAYNANGSLTRTENYIEGEEGTAGINITETEYDERGNAVSSFAYNSLDSSAKVYWDNGQDETDEADTYTAFDRRGRVTAITQSTEEGEANTNDIRYVNGLVTRLTSGSNTVNYEYDHRRRKSKVLLNGAERIRYEYEDNAGDGDIVRAIADGVTTQSLKDKRGRLRAIAVNGQTQLTRDYNEDNTLSEVADAVTGSITKFEYNPATKRVVSVSSPQLTENYTYNEFGQISGREMSGTVNREYSFTYKDNTARGLESMALPNGLVYKPQRDVNGRNTGKVILTAEKTPLYGEYIYYRKHGDRATDIPSSVRYGMMRNGKYVISEGLKYTYDTQGNITHIYENGELSARYTYDKLSRLVREDNAKLGSTYTYGYDGIGNIEYKYVSTFTLGNFGEDGKPANGVGLEYHYDAEDKDRLVQVESLKVGYDGESAEVISQPIAYNEVGNPLNYRGNEVKWDKGKLIQYGNLTFSYDGKGRRTVKKFPSAEGCPQGGVVNYIYDNGGTLLRQESGEHSLDFIRDGSGLSSIVHNGTTYVVRKNVQGDVAQLLDTTGRLVAKYVYDAWGNHVILGADNQPIADHNHIGSLNPYRYRSYLYDREIGLYWLNTRFYDPQIGRFISADNVSYLDPETVNGLNLYAYCGNNGVMRVDPNGTNWFTNTWDRVWSGAQNAGNNLWNKFENSTVGQRLPGLVESAGTWFGNRVNNMMPWARPILGGVLMLGGTMLTGMGLAFSLIPGLSGVLTQGGISIGTYGYFMMASAWDAEIRADMDAIGWNPFNNNAEATLNSSRVSFYRGVPVVRQNVSSGSLSFGIIFLDSNARYSAGWVNHLNHEWGHNLQLLVHGPLYYGLGIGIPSLITSRRPSHSRMPWERNADWFAERFGRLLFR